jgi:hypothetical protein
MYNQFNEHEVYVEIHYVSNVDECVIILQHFQKMLRISFCASIFLLTNKR